MHTIIQVNKYVKTLRDQSAAQKVKDKEWGGVFQRGEIYDPETIAAEAAAAAAAKVGVGVVLDARTCDGEITCAFRFKGFSCFVVDAALLRFHFSNAPLPMYVYMFLKIF